MKINFIIDKETNFYYWLQISAEWGNTQANSDTQKYFRQFLQNLTPEESKNLDKLEKILKSNPNPRALLAELYLQNFQTNDAQNFKKFAEIFRPRFKKIWTERAPDLKKYQQKIQQFDFQKISFLFKKVKKFYDSKIDFRRTLKIYLLINSDLASCYGFKITTIEEIMLSPNFRKNNDGQENLLTICHEICHAICHAIENQSQISNTLMRNSYAKILKPKNLPPRRNSSWRQMYNESLILSFAGHSTRGIFAKKLFPNSYRKQTNTEDQANFLKYAAENKISDRDLAVLAGMLIEDNIAKYLDQNQKFDAEIADKISEIFVKFGRAQKYNIFKK